ncbi:MAG TPA: zf-HC2 domain-containing protein [Candidatus Acidoferrum sp.]|nr:zf-HC2 domain-containing protein [Candidatus Acidoferrum sp.]
MPSDSWQNKIEAYADAELSADEMRAMREHLIGCASCTSDLLGVVQLKLATKIAGKRYSSSAVLRQRIQQGLPARRNSVSIWRWAPALSATAALAVVAFLFLYGWPAYQQRQTFAELADLHVATLASASPVDVISTDRHTVKPWFQGRIPFTFNIPELSNTPFTLEGGRVTYLDQAPGAQLIFKIANHRISVFIFQNRPGTRFASGDSRSKRLTFNVETWTEDDLSYFVIGDANIDDIHQLSELLRIAART